MYYWPQEKGARRQLPTPNLFISAFWRFLGGSPLAEVLSSCFVSETDNWLVPARMAGDAVATWFVKEARCTLVR